MWFFLLMKKRYLWEKCGKILFAHDISFHGFFYFTLFFMKAEFENIYHKMKNSILIFSNFFLRINSSTKLRWKKFVKMKNSERFYGFCFFLFFRILTQIVKQWLLARRAVSEKFIPRVITWYFHIQKTLSELKPNQYLLW